MGRARSERNPSKDNAEEIDRSRSEEELIDLTYTDVCDEAFVVMKSYHLVFQSFQPEQKKPIKTKI